MTDTASTPLPVHADGPEGPYREIVDGLRAEFRAGRTRSMAWRRAQLEGLLAMLNDHEDDFVRALQEDLGRPVLEAFTADVGASKQEIAHTLKHMERWAKPRRAGVPLTGLPGRARVVPEPLGVALVIAPWNYPIQLLLLPMAAALAAGNCVVAKPSEVSPACSAVLARLIPRYLDDKAVVVIEGGVPETTAILEQRFDHIFYTGSTDVGRVVMRAAAEHLTPVTLELGGKSPTIVAADADLDVAAHRIVWGKTLNAGQTCVANDYLLVEASVRDALVDKMTAVIGEYFGADPQRSDSFGRIVNERHLARLTGLLDGHGGTIVTGGTADVEDRYLAPTIVVDPDVDSPLMTQEIFGPVLPVISVESVDDAIDFVNDRPKPLALYVYSRSKETVERVLGQTSSGGACVNHGIVHLIVPDLPFGGVGPSGMGAYHGQTGFDTFSHLKSVLEKPTKPDPPLLYAPYSSWKEKLIRKVL